MKLRLAAAFGALLFAGCECGPGIACKADTDCGTWGRCELLGASSGYCVELNGDGTPKILVNVDKLDFPAVPCGQTVNLPVEVFNSGGGQLTFSASTGNSTFFSVSANESLDGGAKSTFAVTATTPSSTAAGAEQSGTLTITSNDPSNQNVEVHLTLKASGVTLSLSPPSATFGAYPINNKAPDVDLALTNNGNVPATVMFGQPLDPQFGLTWMGAPGAVTIDPGKSTTLLKGTFSPNRVMPSTTTASISVAEAVCGTSVASIGFSGGGIGGELSLSSADLSFGTNGKVACGTTAAPKTVTLSNIGNAVLNWTGSLARAPSSPFSVALTDGGAVLGGKLNPMQMAELTITPAPIPGVASTTTDGFGDTLTLQTDVPNDTSHPIALRQTASGAVLSFLPGAVDFGMVPVKTTANAPFSVVNEGNAGATVSLVSSSDKFKVAPATATSVDGGATNLLTALFTPDSGFQVDGGVQREDGTLSMSVGVGDVLCAPLPVAMTLTGVGTTGSVSYSPAALNFGSVDCGKTALPKQVTFSNLGTQSYQITGATLGRDSLDGGSPFTLALNPASGVAASDGGTVVITVSPRAIPAISEVTANLYGDILTVTTDVVGDSPHTVALDETARGSIFGISIGSINFGSVAVGATGSSQFAINNSGNAAGTISIANASTMIFSMPQNQVINANTAATQTAQFSPMAPAMYTDTGVVSVSAATVLCKPLPLTMMPLGGQGVTSSVVMISPMSLNFGLVRCGLTGTAKTINVTNNSGQTLNFTLTLGQGGTRYTATGLTTLAPLASGMITVTPKAIPSRATTAPDAFADTLTIQGVGGPVDETHIVDLHQTAQGAALSFVPLSLGFNGSGSAPFSVHNDGNLSATYTLTLSLTELVQHFGITPTSGTVAGPGNNQHTATYTRPLLGGTHDETVSLGSSSTLCSDLPAALQLVGN